MVLPPSQAVLAAKLKPLIRPAILLNAYKAQKDVRGLPDAGPVNRFGGQPSAVAGESWPECRLCAVPMAFVVQFVDASGGDLFVFYYCDACWAQGHDDEHERGTWLIRRYPDPGRATLVDLRTPYDRALLSTTQTAIQTLPHPASLADFPELEGFNAGEYQDAVQQLNGFDDLGTLVGGHPQYLQARVRKHCRICGKTMQFIAQIDAMDSDQGTGVYWGGAFLMYLFQCPVHLDQFSLRLQTM